MKQPHDPSRCDVQECALCKDEHVFDLPDHIVQATSDGRLVIFAGAGISTEKKMVFPQSFLSDIIDELKSPPGALSFPDAMSKFCERPDGRSQLLMKIRRRLTYVRSHPELHVQTTSFHRELATIWQIQEIITTNWDDFFEAQCGATPFITDKDLAFWSQPGRKVLKLHGSMHSLGEIVVTAEDYERCYQRLSTGVLGSQLKMLLADRTIVFVGYSLSDPDLRRILDALTGQMGELRPTYYLVTPDAVTDAEVHSRNIRHIRTDGTVFLSALKNELLKTPHNLPEKRFARIPSLLARVRKAHFALFARRPSAKHPETLYCASYQDGLMNALGRAWSLAKTGEYSHRCALVDRAQQYEEIRKASVRMRNYWDAAYAEGYQNGLILLTADEDLSKAIPLYYVFGARSQPLTFASYCRLAKTAASLHRMAFKVARRLAKRSGAHHSHHPPFLSSIDDDLAGH